MTRVPPPTRRLSEFLKIVNCYLDYYAKPCNGDRIKIRPYDIDCYSYDYRAMFIKFFRSMGFAVIEVSSVFDPYFYLVVVKLDDVQTKIDPEKFFFEYKRPSIYRLLEASGYMFIVKFIVGLILILQTFAIVFHLLGITP